jgi:hypothetical protein
VIVAGNLVLVAAGLVCLVGLVYVAWKNRHPH